jgi:hypothetical protein
MANDVDLSKGRMSHEYGRTKQALSPKNNTVRRLASSSLPSQALVGLRLGQSKDLSAGFGWPLYQQSTSIR